MRALDPRLLRRTRAARPLLVADTALGVLTVVPVVAQAALLAHVVARAFGGAAPASLWPALLLLLAAFATRALLGWGMEVAGRRAAAGVLSDLRLELVERRLAQRPLATDGAASAAVAAVAVQGVAALEAYFARYLPQVVLASVVPPAIVAVVAVLDPLSAGIMLLTLPLVPVFMWLVGRFAEERTRERWRALGALSEDFLDLVRGLPTLRAFDRARAQAPRIAAAGERYRRATLATLRVTFLSGSVLELAATLGVALVAVTAGVRLVGGGLGLQTAMTVLVLAPELYLPLRRLGAEYHASADGLAVAERMLALVDDAGEEAAAPPPPGAPAPDPAVVAVRFEAVSFAYPSRPAAVLDRLDLELSPRETVALVGPSGAGKSTVAALLLGLLAPTGGRITVGHAELRACDPGAWRRRLAWAPQHPALLRGTVADNIRLGDPGASGARVRRAAALAGADAFIARLPQGYETVVGDGGRPLSAGERRRIGLARAFLRDASLLILDEPGADLDPAGLARVAEAIGVLGADRTVLVIAHREELARTADRVVRLEAGAAPPRPLAEVA